LERRKLKMNDENYHFYDDEKGPRVAKCLDFPLPLTPSDNGSCGVQKQNQISQVTLLAAVRWKLNQLQIVYLNQQAQHHTHSAFAEIAQSSNFTSICSELQKVVSQIL